MCTDHGNVSKAYHDRNKFQAQDPSKSIMRIAPPDRRAAYGHIGLHQSLASRTLEFEKCNLLTE